MMEITREILEHYLRATGWTFAPNSGDGWWFGKDWDRNDQRGFPASWLNATALDIDVVVRITGHSKHLASLAFRLGLCAAAEESEHFRLRWVDEKSLPEPVRYAAESSCRNMRDYCLECAGITAAAWESARKR